MILHVVEDMAHFETELFDEFSSEKMQRKMECFRSGDK